jgi:hypothetical protein
MLVERPMCSSLHRLLTRTFLPRGIVKSRLCNRAGDQLYHLNLIILLPKTRQSSPSTIPYGPFTSARVKPTSMSRRWEILSAFKQGRCSSNVAYVSGCQSIYPRKLAGLGLAVGDPPQSSRSRIEGVQGRPRLRLRFVHGLCRRRTTVK